MCKSTIVILMLLSLFRVEESFLIRQLQRRRGSALSILNSVKVDAYDSRFSTQLPEEPMLAYQAVPGHDLMLSVGNSKFGLGLFVNVIDDRLDGTTTEPKRVDVAQGTLMCDYSGSFDYKWSMANDKAVMYKFSTINMYVYDDDCKAVIPLVDALLLADDIKNGVTAKLDNVLQGHLVTLEKGVIEISPLPGYNKTCFMPHDGDTIVSGGTELSFAQFGNDMAFIEGETTTRETYMENSKNNVLTLMWKMKTNKISGCVEPISPCLVTKWDLAFENTRPIELGLTYSWNYWLNTFAMSNKLKR
jgi:hypothetical protein